MSAPTGRARGRARGRSRGGVPQDPRRPGEAQPPPTTTDQPQVGRGRGRAAAPPQAKAQPLAQVAAPQPKAEPRPVPPATELGQMSLNGKEKANGAGAPCGGGAAVADQGGRQRRIAFTEPCTRPEHITDKKGAHGNEISVMSNHIVLRNRPNQVIYQYNVSYTPPIESRKLRCGLLGEHHETLGKVRIFDGMILFLPIKLPTSPVDFTSRLQRDQTDVRVTVTLTNELPANSPTCLQLFNILFRRVLSKMDMIQVGRHFFNKNTPIKIPQHKLELWPGYQTSILQYETNVLLCADVSHKILRTDCVYDYLNDLYQSQRRGDFHSQATKALVGEIVLTRYNNKTYRIDDINWDKSPRSTFTLSTGEDISFLAYYKKAYDIDIQDDQQPMLVSQPKKREVRAMEAKGLTATALLLVPELCTRTGLSDEARADFRVMKDVAVYTRVGPDERVATLEKFISALNSPTIKPIFDEWNLQFDSHLLRYPARTLPPEKIHQKTATFSYRPNEADWSRDMRGNELIKSVGLHNYIILFTSRDADKAEDFCKTLQRVGPPMGITVSDRPNAVCLPNDRTDSYLQAMDRELGKDTQMVIAILPTNRKDRYDAIKKYCCVDHPVPSQCLLGKTLMKKQMLMSVTTKVALQLNCKLGGELWALEIPLKKIMVVGIDTYHDSSTRGRSCCGFVASTNASLTRYYTQCMFQFTGMELADNLRAAMAAALRKYHEVNGALPERIIVYRDGVGDGQLMAVVEHEVPQMMTSIKAADPGYQPKFAVMVVKKRINARIFHESRGQLANPPPGTIVDTEITKPEWYDFYLVSQSVRQGTVSPTHFNVVCDTCGLKPDHMQRLTYKLCHLYYNWPGTVRVPAPCQYAHKVAFLVGQSIHKAPSPDLADRLYYL